MGDLLVKIIPMALGAAASPTMLAVLIVILARPPAALRRGIAFTAAGTIPLLVLSAVVALLWRGASLGGETAQPDDNRAAWVDVGVGVLLLLLGGLLYLRHRRRAEHPAGSRSDAAAAHHGVLRAGVLGFALMATNTSTLLLYIPAAKDIANSPAGGAVKVVGWVVLLLVTMLPMLVTLVTYAVAPGTAQRVLEPLGAWFTRHNFAITLAIFVVLGVYLVVRGGLHLLG